MSATWSSRRASSTRTSTSTSRAAPSGKASTPRRARPRRAASRRSSTCRSTAFRRRRPSTALRAKMRGGAAAVSRRRRLLGRRRAGQRRRARRAGRRRRARLQVLPRAVGRRRVPGGDEADLRARAADSRAARRAAARARRARRARRFRAAQTRADQRSTRRSTPSYLATRPPEAEVEAIRLMVAARDGVRRARAHRPRVVGGSVSRRSRAAKAAALPITAETCPHYLTFAAEEIPDGATEFKCAPPIREARASRRAVARPRQRRARSDRDRPFAGAAGAEDARRRFHRAPGAGSRRWSCRSRHVSRLSCSLERAVQS